MAKRRGERPGRDLVGPAIWLVLAAMTVVLAALVVRPIWDMTAWLG